MVSDLCPVLRLCCHGGLQWTAVWPAPRSLTSSTPHTCWVIFPLSIFRHGPPAHGGLTAIAVRVKAKPLWTFTSLLAPNLAWLSGRLLCHVRLHSSPADPSLLLRCPPWGLWCVHLLCPLLQVLPALPFPSPHSRSLVCAAPSPSSPTSWAVP